MSEFDAERTYDAQDYDDAARDFWQYVAMRSVERLDLQPGERVLDVPCGTGASLIPAAAKVGPTGRVTGIDYAPGMVALARRRAAESGLATIDVQQGDMTKIDPPAVPFDAVVCALGVFFVDDMAELVQSLLDLARPGTGRLLVSVFGEAFFEPLRTVFVDAVASVAPNIDVVEPWRRTEDESTLRQLFERAGVEHVTVVTDEDRLPLRQPSDCWRVVLGSALRHTVKLLGDSAAEVRDQCESHMRAHGVTELLTTSRYALAARRAGKGEAG